MIGQVIEVGDTTSTVRLISDSQSAISARIQSTNAEGFVRGSATGSLTLTNIPTEQEVTPGGLVVSSGLGGTIPAGLLIGSVDVVKEGSAGTSRNIFISPNQGTIGSLQNVLVVTSLSGEPSQLDLYNSATPKSLQDEKPTSDTQANTASSGDAKADIQEEVSQ